MFIHQSSIPMVPINAITHNSIDAVAEPTELVSVKRNEFKCWNIKHIHTVIKNVHI